MCIMKALFLFFSSVVLIVVTSPVAWSQQDPLLLGLTPCCPNNLIQYNLQTDEIETIAEVGTGEYVVADIIDYYDTKENTIKYDTMWVYRGDYFNSNVRSGVLDKVKESIYFIRNSRLVQVSLLDGKISELTSLDDVRELIGLEEDTGRLFARTSCCPNKIVAIEPESGERSVIAEIGTGEYVVVDILEEYDADGNLIRSDTMRAYQGDIFNSITGPSLASADGSQVFFIRNKHLLSVETSSGQLTEGPWMPEQSLMAIDEVEQILYLRTRCCPNKLQKYDLEEGILTTVAEIGTDSDQFVLTLGGAIYDSVNKQFYLRRNKKLLTVTMSGELYVEQREAYNSFSVVGGLDQATRVGVERDPDKIHSGLLASPNPFRGETEITFTSVTNDPIRIEVYDILGRRVEEVFVGQLARGEVKKFRFHAHEYPSGLYFVRYSSPHFSEVKSVVLAK